MTFARLSAWKRADLTTSKSVKSLTKKANEIFLKIPGVSGRKLEQFLAIGKLLLKYPVLVFQGVIVNLRGLRGWFPDDKRWTPKMFLDLLESQSELQEKLQTLCRDFLDIIFPRGIDPPSLRSIPRWLRAIQKEAEVPCEVKPSSYGTRAGHGLFATKKLPRGTCWLFRGTHIGIDLDESMEWTGFGAIVGLRHGARESFQAIPDDCDDEGLAAWKVNEATGDFKPNAVFLDNFDGIYVTLFKDVEPGTEIFAYYGEVYAQDKERGYPKPNQHTIDELQKAIRALHLVHGIGGSKYYRDLFQD